MSHEKEFDLLELIRRSVQAEGLDADAAQRIEQAIVSEAGGLWTRIPKRKSRMQPQQRQQVVADALSNVPAAEIVSKHGIARATLYRIIKRNR